MAVFSYLCVNQPEADNSAGFLVGRTHVRLRTSLDFLDLAENPLIYELETYRVPNTCWGLYGCALHKVIL
jgi:hypothetical protein